MRLGVDPGKDGGWAIIDDFGARACPMPLAGKDIDLRQLATDWRQVRHATVEQVHSMPGQGVASTFSFGKGYGGLLGVLAALHIPTELVTPQAWKKLILAGTTKDKLAAIAWCRRAYPEVSLILPRCRSAHDGMADALAICEYGARMFR